MAGGDDAAGGGGRQWIMKKVLQTRGGAKEWRCTGAAEDEAAWLGLNVNFYEILLLCPKKYYPANF